MPARIMPLTNIIEQPLNLPVHHSPTSAMVSHLFEGVNRNPRTQTTLDVVLGTLT